MALSAVDYAQQRYVEAHLLSPCVCMFVCVCVCVPLSLLPTCCAPVLSSVGLLCACSLCLPTPPPALVCACGCVCLAVDGK